MLYVKEVLALFTQLRLVLCDINEKRFKIVRGGCRTGRFSCCRYSNPEHDLLSPGTLETDLLPSLQLSLGNHPASPKFNLQSYELSLHNLPASPKFNLQSHEVSHLILSTAVFRQPSCQVSGMRSHLNSLRQQPTWTLLCRGGFRPSEFTVHLFSSPSSPPITCGLETGLVWVNPSLPGRFQTYPCLLQWAVVLSSVSRPVGLARQGLAVQTVGLLGTEEVRRKERIK
ncbi:hypothetical protein RRG08_026710 [Elysia crispata]|uniref:Uncharacterized protein n=1 Tax=Elysia crispata TaxID=231223 RepID=A0AAE1CN33_9GAST|nr:hypothetical protein RRG08_026710 [Elysia crispata]